MNKSRGVFIGALLAAGLVVGATTSRCQPDQPRMQAAQAAQAPRSIDAGTPDTEPNPVGGQTALTAAGEASGRRF